MKTGKLAKYSHMVIEGESVPENPTEANVL